MSTWRIVESKLDKNLEKKSNIRDNENRHPFE